MGSERGVWVFKGVLLALILHGCTAHTWAMAPCAGLPSAPSGATYYVATTGDDGNPGTEALPWKTIEKATRTLVAGDTVLIRTGTYRERLVPQNSGTPGNEVRYSSYPGETVTLDGASIVVPEWDGLVNLVGKSNIRVSGLRVINAGPNIHNPGILVGTSSHIIIENNYVSNTTDSGIGVWDSNDVTVDGNEVVGVCTGGFNECISVGGTDTFIVKNNLVHDSMKEGIDTKDGSSNGKVFHNEVHHNVAVGFYIEAWDKHTYNIESFGNVAHDMTQDGFAIASEQGGLLENIKVYNNISYNNGLTGLGVSMCCIATHPMSNIQIVNNTFYNNGKPPWGGGIFLENPQAQGVVIRNNIVSQNLTFQLAVAPNVPTANFSADHNLIDGFRGSEGEITGEFHVEGDALFENAAGADFHLREGSPAIGKGSADGAPPADMEGHPRGNPPDIGAYEHLGAASCWVTCTAVVPSSAQVNAPVDFSGTATPSSICTGSPSFDWDFGDGSIHGTLAQARHTYASPGTFPWTFKASAGDATCTKNGSLVVSSIVPPIISSIAGQGGPFRVRITGSNFQNGVQVTLGSDAAPWSSTVRKNETSILLKGGASLKASFPPGIPVAVRVTNPDGGEAVSAFTR